MALRKVTPVLACLRVVDSCPSDFVFSGERSDALSACSDVPDGIFIKLRLRKLLPLFLSTLVLHVERVFLFRPKKQVVRVNAGSVVAPVKHAEPIRYFSVMNFPRRPMGVDVVFFGPNGSLLHDASVSERSFSANPLPASRSFYDLAKKSFLEWLKSNSRVLTSWHVNSLRLCQGL